MLTGWGVIPAQDLHSVISCKKILAKFMQQIGGVKFSRYMLPSNEARCLVITVGVWSGFRRLQDSRQCAAWHSSKCLKMLVSTAVSAAGNLATRSSTVLGGTAYRCSFTCPHIKKSIGVTSSDWGGHASTIHLPSTFLDTFPSTAGYHPNSAPMFRTAETTNFASQLASHLQAAMVD
jgi:hypothetical protein